MTTDTDIYSRRGSLTVSTDDRARAAVQAFRKLQPTLNSYVKVLTGGKHAKVDLSVTNNGATDGKTIFYRPPLALGDNHRHNRALCDKRGPDKILLCEACAVREDVLVTIYHEIAHIAYDSFDETDDRDRYHAVKRIIDLHGGRVGDRAKARIDAAPYHVRSSYIGLASLISPWLPIVVNSLEDARVNAKMFKSRPGTKVMFDANTWKIFRDGVEQVDATGETIVKEWRDYPLNLQVIIGLFCVVSEYSYADWFQPVVVEALQDEKLNTILDRAREVRNAKGIFEISFDAYERLRELGFCEVPDDKESDEDGSDSGEDQPGEESSRDQDEAGESDTGGSSTDRSEESPDNGPRTESDAPEEPESGSEDSSQPGESSGDSAGTDPEPEESGGTGGEVEPDGPESEDSAGDPEPDGSVDEGSSGDPSEGTDAESGESSGDDDRGGSAGADPNASSEAPTPDTTPDDGDSPDSGTGEGESSDREGASEEDSDSSGGYDGDDSDFRDGHGESTEDTRQDELGDTSGPDRSADEAEKDDTSGQGDISGDSEVLPGDEGTPDRSEVPGTPGGTDPGDDPSDDSDSERVNSTPSGEKITDDEAVDSGADEGLGGTTLIGEPEEDEEYDYGTPDEVEGYLEKVGHHEGTISAEEERAKKREDKALEIAIVQGMYFETPSKTIVSVREHFHGKPIMEGNINWSDAWDEDSVYRKMGRTAAGIDSEFQAPESVMGPALLRMRVAFEENARGKTSRNHKSGKVDARVLGKRAFHGDERLFRKKTLPGKRSYHVLIGLDVSGSTVGVNLALEKRAAMAQAQLCHRLGVSFSVFAHTGNYADTGGTLSRMALDMYHIKDADEPWSTEVEKRLVDLGPSAANLDGHTLEYYRKTIERINATDKVIMYYSDGKMPAENHDEELDILVREIATCRKKKIHLMGVGIRTDSPARHGLDTVEVHEDEDIIKVVQHLEKVLKS